MKSLRVLEGEFTIHRLAPDAGIPSAILDRDFAWFGRTDEELSIVCDSRLRLRGDRHESGWSCIKVAGPIDFGETGVLAGVAGVLSAANISIFALSTFDTDYILVKSNRLPDARAALAAAGYTVF